MQTSEYRHLHEEYEFEIDIELSHLICRSQCDERRIEFTMRCTPSTNAFELYLDGDFFATTIHVKLVGVLSIHIHIYIRIPNDIPLLWGSIVHSRWYDIAAEFLTFRDTDGIVEVVLLSFIFTQLQYLYALRIINELFFNTLLTSIVHVGIKKKSQNVTWSYKKEKKKKKFISWLYLIRLKQFGRL